MTKIGLRFQCTHCDSLNTHISDKIADDQYLPIQKYGESVYETYLNFKCENCGRKFAKSFFTASPYIFVKEFNKYIEKSKDPLNQILIRLEIEYHNV